jgi:prepilin-type N-terminal cleavage/methylation domain-containing protein
MPANSKQQGFTLIEVMIGMLLSAILISGIVQLISGSVSAYRLQLSQSQLEESGRYARDVLITHISQAGFHAEPWLNPAGFQALTDESLDGGSSKSDQLGLQRWSRHNCFGNENSIADADGQPAFYLLQTRFSINNDQNLAMTCRYGPSASELRIQINNFGLIEDVESMQILYAEDRDNDETADSWVKAQSWVQESNILAVKAALLLSTKQAFDQTTSKTITLLDETVITPADGHLRTVKSLASAIHGRLK